MQPSSCASAPNFCLSAALRSRVSPFAAAAAFTLVFALALFAPAARAQSVAFAGVQSVLGSGFSEPTSVAVDSSGNVYVADQGNAEVKEILAVNGLIPANPTINVLGSGFSVPSGVAVDASGNVYVVDSSNEAVYEILAVNGVIPASNPTINVLASGFGFVFGSGVAVDASGNVYVADSLNNEIKEIVAVNGVIPSSNPTINVLGSGFSFPYGVAVDASGNVYVADSNNSEIKEIVAVNGVIPASNPTINVLGSGFSYPSDVKVDAGGNVFVVDQGNNEVKEILAVNGSIPASNPTINILATGGNSSQLVGVAVDAKDDVYVADAGNNQIVELQLGAINFGSANVCPGGQATPAPCSNTLTLSYKIPSGATVGSVKILTQGAAGLDFQAQPNDASTTLCTAPIYGTVNANAATCTVDVTFAPLYPGQRAGAAQLYDASGNLLVSTPLYGTGTGPQLAFEPGSISTLGSGFEIPDGVAVDGSGNVYVADRFHNKVKEILAVNGVIPASPTINTLASLSQPIAVAVDGSGNVYVATAVNGLYEILAVNGSVPASNPTINVLVGGSNVGGIDANGLAVDAGGNVYVTDPDPDNQEVKEILAFNGTIPASPTIRVLASGLDGPQGVAVDASGNVYFTEGNSTNEVKEILAVNGAIPANPVINTLGSGFTSPNFVAVDASGNVYVADNRANEIKQILAVNGAIPASNPTINVLGSGFLRPAGVALDAHGNVYVGDTYHSLIKEIGVSAPPSLSFAPTLIGQTSGDSPQSVVIQNVGNAPITGSYFTLSDTTDFSPAFGSGSPAPCESPTLAPGAECSLNFDFTPQSAGPINATATITDNNLNLPGATQTIYLSGTGVAPQPQTIAFGPIAAQTAGTTLALSATATSGLPVSFASTTPSVCTVSGSTATLVAAKTCTIVATQAGDASWLAAAPAAQSFTVNRASQTVSFPPIAGQVVGATVALNATATSGLPLTYSSETPSVCSVSGATATMLAYGTCRVKASQAGNAEYNSNSQSAPIGVQRAKQTIDFAAVGAQPALAVVQLSATSTSGEAATFSSNTPSVCTVSGSTATMLIAGECNLVASVAQTGSYFAATASQGFPVRLLGQTVTFAPIANQPLHATVTLDATATSGLPVVYSTKTPATCTVSGSTATAIAKGTCRVEAVQSGNAVYNQNSQSTAFGVE